MKFTPVDKKRALFITNKPHRRTWKRSLTALDYVKRCALVAALAFCFAKAFLWMVR